MNRLVAAFLLIMAFCTSLVFANGAKRAASATARALLRASAPVVQCSRPIAFHGMGPAGAARSSRVPVTYADAIHADVAAGETITLAELQRLVRRGEGNAHFAGYTVNAWIRVARECRTPEDAARAVADFADDAEASEVTVDLHEEHEVDANEFDESLDDLD